MYRLKSEDEFRLLLNALWDDLFWANVHYQVLDGLRKSISSRQAEWNWATVFWSTTYQAHMDASLLRICRAYDRHSSAIHLQKFLEIIRDHLEIFEFDRFGDRLLRRLKDEDIAPLFKKIDLKRLADDIELSSSSNVQVDPLLKWRNNIVAHKDVRAAVSALQFELDNPLPFKGIEYVIDRGFNVLNRYSLHFDANELSRTYAKSSHSSMDDYNLVFDAIKLQIGTKE